ncbi:sortase [Luteimicrobium sp. DT211]|uniref:sortase n=1 Tax=Luteimicrobium sp. DT211 TaxID=3393412 RepID=UPI003CF7A845
MSAPAPPRPAPRPAGPDPAPAGGGTRPPDGVPAGPDAALPRLEPAGRARLLGSALVAVAALLLGLVLQATVVSPLREARDQHVAYDSYRSDLANGTAPVGQTGADDRLLGAGTAVAILRIPDLGVDDVVLEGTTSKVMLSGPGHRRDTVLPGQAGASVVMGRQSTFGGPFRHLDELTVGSRIVTVTGQGTATYRVTDVRHRGSPLPRVLEPGAGRLTLVSASGTPFLPDDVVRVDATLAGTPFTTPVATLSTQELTGPELAFAGDPEAWPWLVLALGALVLVLVGRTFLASWWGRWHAWLVCLPVLLLVALLAGQETFVLLPNLL